MTCKKFGFHGRTIFQVCFKPILPIFYDSGNPRQRPFMIMLCLLHMRYSHVNLRYMRHTLTCCKRVLLIRRDSASSHTKTLKQHIRQ